MPTIRPRHTVTESDEIAAALDAAAEQWPDLRDDRAGLLRRLIREGAAAISEASSDSARARAAAIRAEAGRFPGVYPPDAAQRLRAEWPA